VDEAAALRAAPAGAVLYLRQPLHPQSATAIRAAIAAGGAWRALVPPAVAGYIDRHGLYRR
jgi:nicotinate-nucleotide adenylyltransferase